MQDSVGFEIFLRDNLSSPLLQAVIKGVANLNRLEKAKGGLAKTSGGLLGSLGGVTGGLGAMLGPIGLATGGVAALGAGLRSVVNTGMDFTKTMSNVKALLNANNDEFERLNQTAISLGASTVFSSTQVAEAMVNAAMAGQSVNEIIASMPGYLNVAAAANLELADAVEIGLSTLHQFQLGADKSIDVADQLTYTTTKSASSMQDLAEGLKYLGPAAAAMKVPLEEVLSVQGVLANNGLRGSVATRALSTAFQRLSNPTSKMAEEMDRLNLRFFDSEGKFVGINNLIGILEGKMKGFTDEQRASTLSILFGNEAFAEMQILLSKGSDELRKFTNEIANSQGTAERVAKTQLDNLTGDVEQFGGAWETLQLKMFKDSESGFRGLVQMGTTFLTRLGESWDYITEPLKEVRDLFGQAWTALQGLLEAVGLTGDKFDGLGYYFKLIKWHLEVMTFSLRTVLKFWTWLFDKLRMGVFYVQSFWEALKVLADGVGEMLQPIATGISNIFAPVGEALKSGAEAVLGFGGWIWDGLKSGFNTVKTNIETFWNTLKSLATGIGELFSPIGDLFEGLFTFDLSKIKSGLSSLFGKAKNQFNLTLDGKLNPPKTDSKLPDGDNKATPPKPTGLTPPMPPIVPVAPGGKDSGIELAGGRGSGKSVVVHINNLINNLTVEGANITENIKEVVAKALIEAVNDFEQSYS